MGNWANTNKVWTEQKAKTYTPEETVKKILSSPNHEIGGSFSFNANDGKKYTYTPATVTQSSPKPSYVNNRDIAGEAMAAAKLGNWDEARKLIYTDRAEKIAKSGGDDGGMSNDDLWKSLISQNPESFNRQQQINKAINLINEKTPKYSSKYDSIYEDLLNQYNNYSFDKFKQGTAYKDMASLYDMNGQNAMKDVLGEIAARTGGMASSYASNAATGQYQQYMAALTQLAQEMYGQEKGNMLNKLNIAGQRADQEYARYESELDRNSAERQYALNMLMNMDNNEAQTEQARIEAEQKTQAENVKFARENIVNMIQLGGVDPNELVEKYPELVAMAGYNALDLLGMQNIYKQNLTQQDFENNLATRKVDISQYNADTNLYKAQNPTSSKKTAVTVDWNVVDSQTNPTKYIIENYASMGFKKSDDAIKTYNQWKSAGKKSSQDETPKPNTQTIPYNRKWW